MKRFQSVAGFTKLGLRGIRFCESLDKYVYEFLICICEYMHYSLICSNSKLEHFHQLGCYVNI